MVFYNFVVTTYVKKNRSCILFPPKEGGSKKLGGAGNWGHIWPGHSATSKKETFNFSQIYPFFCPFLKTYVGGHYVILFEVVSLVKVVEVFEGMEVEQVLAVRWRPLFTYPGAGLDHGSTGCPAARRPRCLGRWPQNPPASSDRSRGREARPMLRPKPQIHYQPQNWSLPLISFSFSWLISD